jgi:hypothetical protein
MASTRSAAKEPVVALTEYTKQYQLLLFYSLRLVALAAAAKHDMWTAAVRRKTEKETEIRSTLQAKAAARALIACRTPALFSLPSAEHILKSQGNRHILPGVKCALIQRCFVRELSNAREVAAAAAAANLCRQRLVLKQDQCVSSPPSPRPLSIPPPAPSLACIPILLAALTPAFSSRQSPQQLLSLLVHAGISSDESIPYISHAQMAAVGVPSHLTHAVLTLVRSPPLHPAAFL